MKKEHRRKLIAPIVITVLLALYYVGFALFCLGEPDMPVVIKLLCTIVPLALAGVGVYVLIQRIKEIRSGEEDDLSQY